MKKAVRYVLLSPIVLIAATVRLALTVCSIPILLLHTFIMGIVKAYRLIK